MEAEEEDGMGEDETGVEMVVVVVVGVSVVVVVVALHVVDTVEMAIRGGGAAFVIMALPMFKIGNAWKGIVSAVVDATAEGDG